MSPLARTHSGAFKPHLQVLNVEGGLSWIAQSVELSFFRFSLSEIKNAPHLSNIPPGVGRVGFKNNNLYYNISGVMFVTFFCYCCFHSDAFNFVSSRSKESTLLVTHSLL